MDDQRALRWYGVGRTALGVVLLVAPRLAKELVGPDASRTGVQVVVRIAAIRDTILGLGTVLATRNATTLSHWALLGSVADSADAIVTLAGRNHLPRGVALRAAALAASGAVTGGLLAARLANRR
jgi:hypothetical protein